MTPPGLSVRASVVIPAYNGERYISAAVESILSQSAPPTEVIVVDDGSTDATVSIVEGFGAGVKLVRQDRGGAARARNLGIATAQGDLIAFLDQDDLWVPDKLKIQHRSFVSPGPSDVSVGHIQRFMDDPATGQPITIGDPTPGFLSVTMLARRDVFSRIGGFDPDLRFSDSADWFLRASAAGLKVKLEPELLTRHRDHGRNLSIVEGDQARGEFLRLIKAKLDGERREAARAGHGSGDRR